MEPEEERLARPISLPSRVGHRLTALSIQTDLPKQAVVEAALTAYFNRMALASSGSG
jgi:hypothetical protein